MHAGHMKSPMGSEIIENFFFPQKKAAILKKLCYGHPRVRSFYKSDVNTRSCEQGHYFSGPAQDVGCKSNLAPDFCHGNFHVVMKRTTEAISVLIVDDHRLMRDGLKSNLEKDKKISAVYEAGDGHTAILLAEKYHPDIVIMDINLPDCTGVHATRQILGNNPALKVLGLSMHKDKIHVAGMMKAGAAGFLTKTCSAGELSEAIHKIISGKPCFCDEVLDCVVDMARNPLTHEGITPENPLTMRESQILKHIADGHTSRKIARILKISTRTVEQHRKNIMNKLDIRATALLTKFAIRQGLTFLE